MKKKTNKICKDDISTNVVCEYCFLVLASEQHMKVHVNGVHRKRRMYRCSKCAFQTYYSGNLSRHSKAHHPEPSILDNVSEHSDDDSDHDLEEITQAENSDGNENDDLSQNVKDEDFPAPSIVDYVSELADDDSDHDLKEMTQAENSDGNDNDYLSQNVKDVDEAETGRHKRIDLSLSLCAAKGAFGGIKRLIARKKLKFAKTTILAKIGVVNRNRIDDVNNTKIVFQSRPRPYDFLRATNGIGLSTLEDLSKQREINGKEVLVPSASGVTCMVDKFAPNLFNPRSVVPLRYQVADDIDWSVADQDEKWEYVAKLSIQQRFALLACTVGIPNEFRRSYCIAFGREPLHICFKCQFWFYQEDVLTSHTELHHHNDTDDQF